MTFFRAPPPQYTIELYLHVLRSGLGKHTSFTHFTECRESRDHDLDYLFDPGSGAKTNGHHVILFNFL